MKRFGLFESMYDNFACDVCERDITKSLKIICGVCDKFYICAHCLCNGVETGTHKKEHTFYVANKLEFPLFDSNWSAHDDLMLLD